LIANLSGDPIPSEVEQQTTAQTPILDPSLPPPFPFQDEPVIISVDAEAWEFAQNIVTEVGIATLDTRDLKNVPPGEGGKNWHNLIRARHFRIAEHMNYENSRWVMGNAAGFEFGKSEIIGRDEAAGIIATCFREPFSKPLGGEQLTDVDDSSETQKEKPKRNIIFLGHNPSADIVYLQKLSYNPLNLSNLLETLDTADLFRAHMKEHSPRSVGNILAEFELPAWNLHNAGNDAVYTMWILISTCVRQAMAGGKEN
jgi:DNA polymerase III subunit epsilon-like, C-terminal domain